MMVSERSHHKDVKGEKKLKYAYPLQRYSVFKFEFSRKKCQNLKNKKHTFFWNSKLYVVTKFQVNCVKTKKDE